MNAPYSPQNGYSPNGPYGAFPPPPPPPRSGVPPWVWVLLGAGLLGLGTCGAVVGVIALGSVSQAADGEGDRDGVQIGGQISGTTLEKLKQRKLLRDGEQLIAYYDGTVSLDMSEVTLLTKERITYVNGSRVTTIALADIASIDHRVENIIGDVIEVRSTTGERMRVEVAHFNGGVSLLNALEDETREVKPNVIVHREAPR